WKVEVGFWWVAMQADEQGREIPGTAKRFPTHAEALAYADRQARTRRYVLPRDNTVVPLPACMEKEEKPIMLHRWGEQIIIECTAQGEEEVIFIHDDELKPLALALLAHAERMHQ
ncbi:TPA: hypothetical protein I8W56_002743, partial [Corynebacterium striatum]|nr:hypothetical protein [Corynebacterium striatum]HAT1507169.1 hypothetical protein [Corynebacterium striatum]